MLPVHCQLVAPVIAVTPAAQCTFLLSSYLIQHPSTYYRWLAAVLTLDNKLLPARMHKGGRHEARLVLEGKPYLHPVAFANKGERT